MIQTLYCFQHKLFITLLIIYKFKQYNNNTHGLTNVITTYFRGFHGFIMYIIFFYHYICLDKYTSSIERSYTKLQVNLLT